MNHNFFGRIRIFFGERYPLFIGVLSSFIGTLCIYLVWAAITPGAAAIISRGFFAAFVTMFLITIILRLSDEIKDKDADARLFPERCLPAGKVKYSDIYILLGFFVVVFLGLNLFISGDYTIFAVLCAYMFLFYKYFFLPKIIANDILLALITHNPLMFVTSFYILSFFAKEQELPIFSNSNILLAIGFWMPSLIWETSRKIKAPHRETDYETYSLALGPRRACLLPLGGLTVQLAIIIYLVRDLHFAHYIIIGSSVFYLLYLFQYALFFITLKSRFCRYFQILTEGHIIANSALIVIVCLMELMR